MTFRNRVSREKLAFAREQRKNPGLGELDLWQRLRRKQLGVRFRRQVVMLGWIVDFWCPAKRLVIEIDGTSHESKKQLEADAFRDRTLRRRLMVRTLRFKAEDVMNDVESVVSRIVRELALDENTQPETESQANGRHTETSKCEPSAPLPADLWDARES